MRLASSVVRAYPVERREGVHRSLVGLKLEAAEESKVSERGIQVHKARHDYFRH